MLPGANTQRQEGKYPTIKVLQGCILKLSLNSVNSVPILYRTGNMQSAILLSFVASSVIITFSQFIAHPLQNRQYAICHTFIICRLFFPTTIWASIYPPTNALLYQSICGVRCTNTERPVPSCCGSGHCGSRLHPRVFIAPVPVL